MKRHFVPVFAFFIFVIFKLSAESRHFVGVAYYPEQSGKEQIIKDAKIMQEAHFNIVRMGDFAWYNMEPKDNSFSFEWLDFTINEMYKNGIQTLLATPTAAIPKWLYDAHPEIMQISQDGKSKTYGRRRHACLNNDLYRSYCVRIATKMAEHYKDNQAVIGFQIDNELGSEDSYCYCSSCQLKFVEWLKVKYKTIGNLNKAWGTTFWSETLDNFEQVWLPHKMDNPAIYLDFERFNSDCTIDFFNLQRNAIKKIAPRFKITTNMGGSGFENTIDMYQLAKNSDMLSVDNYPINCTLENFYQNNTGQPFDPDMVSFALQQIRGGRDENIWITEQQIGKTALVQREIVQPGMARLWAHQEVAFGAETIIFFPFRSFESGHEHLMAGVLESDNVKREKYNEIQKTCEELQNIYQKTGKIIPSSKAAIIRDFNSDWVFDTGYTFNPDLKYRRAVFEYYKALRENGVMTDVISPESNFDNYDLIVVPYQVFISPELVLHLQKAAERGASIIVTCMSGLRDNQMHKTASIVLPELQRLVGININSQEALFAIKKSELKFENSSYACSLWFDNITLTKANPIANFAGNYFKDSVAITRNKIGKGTIYYVCTIPEQRVITQIAAMAIKDVAIQPLAFCQNSLVEISEMVSLDKKRRFIYIINFSSNDQKIQLSKPVRDIIELKDYEKIIDVKGMDFKILELK